MKGQVQKFFLLLWILIIPVQIGLSQDRKTKNNYTGDWETPTSWDPTWANPQASINNLDVTIYGYITANSSLIFSGSGKLIVDDTLVIRGNLTIDGGYNLQITEDGILIVWGNLFFGEDSDITVDGYLIVTGDLIKQGSEYDGKFDGDDEEIRVFIGGSVLPEELTDDKENYELINCNSPSEPYPHSGCSYGNMNDLMNDPIYQFFLSTCATVSLTSSEADNSFCAGTSVTFTAGGGINYNFRINGTSVQDGGLTTYTTTTLTNGNIVDVIVTNSGGCTVTSSGITNTVFALPEATATSNSPVCAGSPLTLTGGPAEMATYSWTGPDAFTSSTQSPTVSSAATGAMAGVYSLTVTDANGCTSAAVTTTVVINASPVAVAGANQELCNVNNTTLAGNNPTTIQPTATGLWTLVNGPNVPVITDAGLFNSAVTGMIAGEYIFRWTVSNGVCDDVSDEVSVFIYASPVANAGADQELCNVNNTTLAGNNPTTIQPTAIGLWTLVSGPNIPVITNAGLFNSAVTGMIAGEYIFRWTVSNGVCDDVSDEVIVFIYAATLADAGTDQELCNVNNTTLDGNNPTTIQPTATGLWTLVNGPNVPVITNPALFNSTVTGMITGDYIFRWTVSNGVCDDILDEVSVFIYDPPVADAGVDQEHCDVTGTTLTGNNPLAFHPSAIGLWTLVSGPNVPVIIDAGSFKCTVKGMIAGEYIFRWTVSFGACDDVSDVSVFIYATPVADAGPDQEITFIFETQMEAELLPGETGTWSVISGSGLIHDIHSPTTRVSKLSIGENIFLWKVINMICEEVEDVKIKVNDLFVPTVITPNGDGVNDVFIIDEYNGRMELVIFNRWGNEEYRSSDYKNDWDGRNHRGVILPSDTYFYILKIENGKVKKGSVLIKR